MAGQKSQPLPDVQRWVFEAISHAEGARAGIAAGAKSGTSGIKGLKAHEVIRRSKSMTSLERLEIYHTSYYMRLVDILGSDFSAVKYAVGDELFDRIAKDYIAKHPSQHYSLNFFGAKFPAFLRRATKLKNRPFLSDVAKLQWSIEEVFDQPDVKLIGVDDLLSVPQERWTEARLHAIPALRLVASRYPVNAFFTAFRQEQKPSIPLVKPSWVCVYRKKYDIWRMDLTRPEYTILTALVSGKTVGEAIESALELPEIQSLDLGASVTEWFRVWTGSGFFHKVELPSK